MKIKMRTTIANAKITAISGSVIDLAKEEADVLIKGGYAEAVNEKTVETTVKQPIKDKAVNQPTDNPNKKGK